ncbi:MAG: BamA/TamA family outer membrane protein [bacterium]|nr:BamA/TamA family outer membrane protein [bacterium]
MSKGTPLNRPHPGSPAYLAILLFLLAVTLPLTTIAQSGARVTKIDFSGNDTFSDGALRTILKSASSSGVSGIFGEEGDYLYDEDQFALGIANVQRFYQQEGYALVRIAPPEVIKFDARKDEVQLRIVVVEGQPMLIDSIGYEISGVDESERSMLAWHIKRARDEFILHVGSRFRDSSLIIDRDSLILLMSNQGYPHARIEQSLRVDTVAARVAVTWRISAGSLATFGETEIVGNERFQDREIARVLAFQTGQRYDRRLVLRTQKQVYALGMFQVATVHPNLSDSAIHTIPVTVSVREGAKYKLKLGAGYGREEEFRTFGDIRKYGFFGGARTLRLYVKHSGIEPYNIRLSLIQPAFLHPRTTLTLSPFVWRQDEKAYDVRRIGGDIQLSHAFTEQLSGAATYTYESVKLNELSTSQVELYEGAAIDEYTKSTIALGGQFDNSRPLFSPTRGFFIATNVTLSGLGFGSDFHFWKIVSEARHYRRLSPFTLALRAKIGGAKEFSTEDIIPLEERLFSGGSSSVRGWGRQELGPTIDGDPVGGRSLFESNVELRFPILGLLTGAAFVDFGNVWLNSFDFPLGDLRYSAGLGIRVTTPIGPIRLDVATPVSDVDKTTQVHISVGQAF